VRSREPGTCRRRLAVARSLMVTPWFAAGAGIVIAAALAVDSPAALTYVPAGPAVRCPAGNCPGAAPSRGPDVAAATPGVPLPPGSGPNAGTSAGLAPHAGNAAAYELGYQVVRRSPGGFLATITMPANMRPGPWTLHLAFASARVDRVWGARWQPSGNGDAGTAAGLAGAPGPGRASGPWPGRGRGHGQGQPGGGRVTISATGTATTPSACRLDGVSCRFG
jgi:hypothetical protein